MRTVPCPATAGLVALCLAATSFAQSPEPTEAPQARALSAFFGLDNRLPPRAERLCPGAPGRDGMPVVLSHTVNPDTLQADDFLIETRSGAVRKPLCVTLRPAHDAGELRTVLLIGEFGDEPDDPPVRVRVAEDLFSDGASGRPVNFRGAEVDVTPLDEGPSLVLAEALRQQPAAPKSADNAAEYRHGSRCPADTPQVVRVTWAGGVRLPGGKDLTNTNRTLYRVSVKRPDGATEEVAPTSIADLGDRDNNHLLCLGTSDPAVLIAVAAGQLVDPNQDLNPATRVTVTRD